MSGAVRGSRKPGRNLTVVPGLWLPWLEDLNSGGVVGYASDPGAVLPVLRGRKLEATSVQDEYRCVSDVRQMMLDFGWPVTLTCGRRFTIDQATARLSLEPGAGADQVLIPSACRGRSAHLLDRRSYTR